LKELSLERSKSIYMMEDEEKKEQGSTILG